MPKAPSKFVAKARPAKVVQRRSEPLWRGPTDGGPHGGVTQSMLSNWLCCRERFRLKYLEGLRAKEGFSHRLEYGQLWHACEEAHAAGVEWGSALERYASVLAVKYPLSRADVKKWYMVCKTQFPIYVDYWSRHDEVVNRTPIFQEKVFDVPYQLRGSGRVVRLRGKYDAVDLIRDKKRAGIYLKENKTKGDVDPLLMQRQLIFDLQTMLYLTTLRTVLVEESKVLPKSQTANWAGLAGVRYNVVRRPLSGGKGTIKQKEGSKNVRPETPEEYWRRLQQYFIDEPEHWFMRWRVEVSPHDLTKFEDRFLQPVLEGLCDWYECQTECAGGHPSQFCQLHRSTNYQFPFGVVNYLTEGGATDYDNLLEIGSEVGLRRQEKLFQELQ